MKDGIIKGTGNSRYLKGAGWPATYAEFKSMAEAGTLPFDLNGINAAGWQQIGDALNKASLLDDDVGQGLAIETVCEALKGSMAKIIVTVESGSTVTCANGTKTITRTSNGTVIFYVPYGTWTVTATLGNQSASGTITADTVKEYELSLAYVKVYGVSWDGTATTAWSRTDDAADFIDPVPYVAGATTYGSPFDNLFPWNQMVKETRTGGVMVKIPKFWYQQEKIGSTFVLRIAGAPKDGFHVCPACMDRGDGAGELDAAYIARYHCNSSYMSATGASPLVNITRSSARSSIHAK